MKTFTCIVCLLSVVTISLAFTRSLGSDWTNDFGSFLKNVMSQYKNRPASKTVTFQLTFGPNGNKLETIETHTDSHGNVHTKKTSHAGQENNAESPTELPYSENGLNIGDLQIINPFSNFGMPSRLHNFPIGYSHTPTGDPFSDPPENNNEGHHGGAFHHRFHHVSSVHRTHETNSERQENKQPETETPGGLRTGVPGRVESASATGNTDTDMASDQPALPGSETATDTKISPYGQHVPVEQVTCSEEYRKIKGHTMCIDDDPRMERAGVFQRDKKLIVDLHNEYRSKVEPPAVDLCKLRWDDRLAAVAQKWANQCKAGHDSNKHRSIPSLGMSIGQNVAGGYKSWKEAVFHWWDEIRLWKYGIEPESYLGSEALIKIGHFTQMAQNGTYLVGCGFAYCNFDYKRYYVCNYAAGQSNLATPYTRAYTEHDRCSVCPNKCVNGLCDCHGKVCSNGGSLDPATCQCACAKPYGGPTCDTLMCPAEDKWVCGRDWPPSYCDEFVNVPQDCPFMCGVCKSNGTSRNTYQGKETTFTSKFGCSYTGIRSTPDECKAYGDRGQDTHVCATKGGEVGCDGCSRYYNVKRDMCPVMCGICDPPCGGKECKNNGSLDPSTCTCTCAEPYEGPTCEDVDCTISDRPQCQRLTSGHCQKYINVPGDCRHMCGLCPV